MIIEQYDVVVVGAGPAGSSAARAAARAGARVLALERKREIGVPVRCAEYVPRQIRRHIPWSSDWVAQAIDTMRTHLPDGEIVATPAAGYMIHRDRFDRGLAAAARRVGVRILTGTAALEPTDGGLIVRRGRRTLRVGARVIVGADGPGSTVRAWMGITDPPLLFTAQCRVHLRGRQSGTTDVYFDPEYVAGYGWLFPKGAVANVGVGLCPDVGMGPGEALRHLLDRLQIPASAIISRNGGWIPSGGPPQQTCLNNLILVGDAAGQTHPITGAGVAHACLCGQMAGRAAARATLCADLNALHEYEREWREYLGGVLIYAVAKRRLLESGWSQDRAVLSRLLHQTWVAFPAYGRAAQTSATMEEETPG